MSKSEKLKEQLTLIRSLMLALFALIVFALLKEYSGLMSWIVALFSTAVIAGLTFTYIKKLDELGEED